MVSRFDLRGVPLEKQIGMDSRYTFLGSVMEESTQQKSSSIEVVHSVIPLFRLRKANGLKEKMVAP